MKVSPRLKKLSWRFDPFGLVNARELYDAPTFPILEEITMFKPIDVEWFLKLGGGAPILSFLDVSRIDKAVAPPSFFSFGELMELHLGANYTPLDVQVILSQCPKLRSFLAPNSADIPPEIPLPSSDLYHPNLNTVNVLSPFIIETLTLPGLKDQTVHAGIFGIQTGTIFNKFAE